MGIRFACNLCEQSLNIKRELAGKIGVCPQCGGKIRIPLEDAPRSQAIAVEPTPSGPTSQLKPTQSTGTLATPTEGSATLEMLESDSRSPESPLDQPGAKWYVRPPAGGQYGPAGGEVLRSWIAENRVTASTLIWRDGWPQWRSARETLPEFAEFAEFAESARHPSSSPNGVESHDLFEEPLVASSQAPAQPLAGAFTGNAAIGHQRSNRNQRRMALVIALAVLSIFLILTLVVLAIRS